MSNLKWNTAHWPAQEPLSVLAHLLTEGKSHSDFAHFRSEVSHFQRGGSREMNIFQGPLSLTSE